MTIEENQVPIVTRQSSAIQDALLKAKVESLPTDYGNFDLINMGKKYYHSSTHAPIQYGEATMISVIGHRLGREVVNYIQPKAVYHNVYMALVGKSTWTHKTTGQELGQEIDDPENRMPNEASPEAVINALSRHPQGYWWMGEVSKYIKGIKSGNYLSTIAEVLNDMFNCPAYYKKELTGKGKSKDEPTVFEIHDAYLTVHTTITPEVLQENTTREMTEGGFLGRFLLVFGKPVKGGNRTVLPSNIETFTEIIRNALKALDMMDKENHVFMLSKEALERYNEIEAELSERDVASVFCGRYLNYIISFADVYMLSEAIGIALAQEKNLFEFSKLVDLVKLVELVNNNTETFAVSAEQLDLTKLTKAYNSTKSTKTLMLVYKKYIDKAWEFIKPCLDYAQELCTYVDMSKPTAKVRDLIKNWKIQPAPHSPLLSNSNLDLPDFTKAIESLKERGEITEEWVKTDDTGRYKKKVYHWNDIPIEVKSRVMGM